MSRYQNLKLTVEDRIAVLEIHRPRVLNALNEATMDEIDQAFSGPLRQDEVGAVIVTGAGEKSFISGADIKELAGLDPLTAKAKSAQGQAILDRMEGFPKPVLAAINGYCLGGGCELALACHIRMASPNARIGLPEVKLGLIPGFGGTQRLARLVGKGRALEMVLSGEAVTAEEAAAMGLVNRVVPAGDLRDDCRALAAGILSNGPLAVQYSIEAINVGLGMPLEEASRLEANFFALTCATEDMREGTTAFLEKRAPQFKGK